jgi:predicted RNA methylase
MLPMLAKIASLLPTHTRRSEESEALQQFSTPIMLALAASAAAAISPADIVLEPSAGTGLLAILAELSGASLVLNELAETRAGLLSLLFPGVTVTRFDAAQIDDHLDSSIKPGVVLMNPPFSAVANVDRRMADAALRHIASALARLPDGGRLVAITGASCSPDNPVWRDAFIRLQERGRVVFTAAIAGAVFAKHGTTIETRLTVIDRLPADDPTAFSSPPGVAPDVATLLGWVTEYVPSRLPIATAVAAPSITRPAIPRTVRAYAMRPSAVAAPSSDHAPVELAYESSHGHRLREAGSPRRFTKNTHFSRSVFPALSRIPPSWYNQQPWLRWRRPFLPIGRTFRRTSLPTACCPMRSLSPSFMRARRTLSSSRDHGLLTKPMTSSARRATMQTMPYDSGVAGFWEMAPARARDARSPASCSTTG